MKNYLFILLICLGCASKKEIVVPKFESKIVSNEKLSCRAIFVDTDKVWLGMDKGRYGL